MQTTATIHGPHRAATLGPAASSGRTFPIARIATILGALLLEGLLILGIVLLSLGIGAEGQPGLGPDHPPPPMPAPVPPPDPVPVLALSVDANQRSVLLAGHGA